MSEETDGLYPDEAAALILEVVMAPPPNKAQVNLPVPANTLTMDAIREAFEAAAYAMTVACYPHRHKLESFLEHPWESSQEILAVVDLPLVRKWVRNAIAWASWAALPKGVRRRLDEDLRRLAHVIRPRELKKSTASLTITIEVSGLPSDVEDYGERLMGGIRSFTRKKLSRLAETHNNRIGQCACGGIVTSSPGVPDQHSLVGDRPFEFRG